MKTDLVLTIETQTLRSPKSYEQNWYLFSLNSYKIKLCDLIVQLNWTNSKSKARKLIEQGAINDGFYGSKITNPDFVFEKYGLDNLIFIQYKSAYKSALIQIKHKHQNLFWYCVKKSLITIKTLYWILKDKLYEQFRR